MTSLLGQVSNLKKQLAAKDQQIIEKEKQVGFDCGIVGDLLVILFEKGMTL